MKLAEEKKLKDIPSKFDSNEILQIVHSSVSGGHKIYFTILKSISHSDDRELSEWLSISEKTFRNHKTTDKVTKPSLREHAIMLISLFKHGIEIFGNQDKFKKWLKTENFYFGQKSPTTFIDTASGIKFIDDRLTGIEYGDNV
ncbi:MAG: MbcA/ParS/Xre antitoxin family protein [Crocinitomicaceae bacterium]|nr:MbcA/ParS/Xre antitoxin family protein [Crocinitomicaceae bacterium]